MAVLGLIFLPKFFNQNKPVACTMEAKLCPDGSAVGRTGPNCEFAACPQAASNLNQDSWKTFSDPALGVSFKYPEKLSADYISTAEWPPVVKVISDKFSCPVQVGTPSLPDRKVKTINSQTYCLESMSEGAAGTTYTTYTYTTAKDNQLISLTFTLRYPQCLNYDNPQQADCLSERQSFSLDALVDSMIESVNFKSPVINDFTSCAAAGYPIMESYPRRCKTFTENIGNELEKMDLIRVGYPRPNQIVVSPLMITGEARGTWFFEASFPVILKDANGQIIASGIAQAKSDWMTENFVPFEAKLEFARPQTSTGVLILRKDNPSGLPEHDDFLEMPVNLGDF